MRVARRNFRAVGFELNVVGSTTADGETVAEIDLIVGPIRPIDAEQERRRALNGVRLRHQRVPGWVSPGLCSKLRSVAPVPSVLWPRSALPRVHEPGAEPVHDQQGLELEGIGHPTRSAGPMTIALLEVGFALLVRVPHELCGE